MARGAKTTLFNTNTTPVVCDGEGHIVEGGGRREVDKVDEVGREAVDHGLLVEESGDDSADPESGGAGDEAPAARKASGASAPKKPS